MLPVTLAVGYIASRDFERARAGERANILRDTELLASRLSAVPIGAERLATTVATLGRWTEPRECERQLRAVQSALAPFSDNAAYAGLAVLSPAGVLCEVVSGSDDPPSRVVANAGLGLAGIGSGLVRFSETGPGKRALLWVTAKAASNVSPDRAVLVVIDTSSLERLLGSYRSLRLGTAMLLDRSGHSISGPDDQEGGFGSTRDLALVDGSWNGTRESGSAHPTIYASSKLRGVDLWLATAEREKDALQGPMRSLLLTALTPLLLLLIASAAIWIGLKGTVLSWVGLLRDAAASYAGGTVSARIGDARGAPREFQELASAFDTLAGRIADRTNALEREVAAKTGYIRELHHRVKNTLQVIGSLISLQKREVGPAHRAVLRFPEDRVNAMSAAFRASYAISELGRAGVGGLVRELVHRLQGTAEGRPADFTIDLVGEEQEVSLDAAISLAMLLAELLPPYVDASSQSGHPVRVTVAATPDTLDIIIQGRRSDGRPEAALSRRFTQAYLRQLNATLDVSRPDEARLHAPYPR